MITSFRQLFHRVRSFFQRAQLDHDLDAEISSHLQLAIDENLQRGLSPAEARRQALLRFGGPQQAKEQHREARSLPFLETLLQDLRFAFRMLRKSPGFTAVAVLTLALGIGANTAIFSVVNSALLRPLAYREPGRLYLVREIVPQLAKFAPELDANLPDFLIWQKQVHSFADVAIAESTTAGLTGAGEPEMIRGVRASANIFDVLGAQPALGRTFLPEEDDPGSGHVVILTDAFWRARFQADRSVLGKTIVLDGIPNQVVGVLPVSYRFVSRLPLAARTAPFVSLFSSL